MGTSLHAYITLLHTLLPNGLAQVVLPNVYLHQTSVWNDFSNCLETALRSYQPIHTPKQKDEGTNHTHCSTRSFASSLFATYPLFEVSYRSSQSPVSLAMRRSLEVAEILIGCELYESNDIAQSRRISGFDIHVLEPRRVVVSVFYKVDVRDPGACTLQTELQGSSE